MHVGIVLHVALLSLHARLLLYIHCCIFFHVVYQDVLLNKLFQNCLTIEVSLISGGHEKYVTM